MPIGLMEDWHFLVFFHYSEIFQKFPKYYKLGPIMI